MSYSVSISGHIDTSSPDAAGIEADLAVKIHEVLTSRPEYGVMAASMSGQFSGQVNLLAAPATGTTETI